MASEGKIFFISSNFFYSIGIMRTDVFGEVKQWNKIL